MTDVRQELRDLVERAQQLHAAERQATIESVLLVGEFGLRNAAVNLCMTLEYFAATIGLSIDQYLKRAQAARLIQRFPRALAMLRAGETRVSHLAMISAKVTDANSSLLLDGIRNKSKRDVALLLSRVTRDGRILEKEGVVDLHVTVTEAQLALLDRAREVLSHGGHVPTNAEIVIKALNDLLERRDPIRKATRAAARGKVKITDRRDDELEEACDGNAPGHGEPTALGGAMLPETAALGHEGQSAHGETLPSKAAAPAHDPSAPDGTGLSVTAAPGHGGQGAHHVALWSATAAPEHGTPNASPRRNDANTQRRAIPAYVRHAVWLRDLGQCTWRQRDGRRCAERMMLELDHIQMFCRGGKHELRNLTLRCRHHNQAAAESELGVEFMARARAQGA